MDGISSFSKIWSPNTAFCSSSGRALASLPSCRRWCASLPGTAGIPSSFWRASASTPTVCRCPTLRRWERASSSPLLWCWSTTFLPAPSAAPSTNRWRFARRSSAFCGWEKRKTHADQKALPLPKEPWNDGKKTREPRGCLDCGWEIPFLILFVAIYCCF